MNYKIALCATVFTGSCSNSGFAVNAVLTIKVLLRKGFLNTFMQICLCANLLNNRQHVTPAICTCDGNRTPKHPSDRPSGALNPCPAG